MVEEEDVRERETETMMTRTKGKLRVGGGSEEISWGWKLCVPFH